MRVCGVYSVSVTHAHCDVWSLGDFNQMSTLIAILKVLAVRIQEKTVYLPFTKEDKWLKQGFLI